LYLIFNAFQPTAVLAVPVVFDLNAQKPTAVLFDAVLQSNAFLPIAVLALPTVLINNA
jgi:hypothetical protein